MRGRADIFFFFFSHRISARSQQSKFANLYSPPNPHILTRHRSTAAELLVAGMETSRTELLIEEPTPESNDLPMSRLRIRDDYAY